MTTPSLLPALLTTPRRRHRRAEWCRSGVVSVVMWVGSGVVCAQDAAVNAIDSLVPAYELPPPLLTKAGRPVRTAEEWRSGRRPEIVADFEHFMFGRVPAGDYTLAFETVKRVDVFDGEATLQEIAITVARAGKSVTMNLALFLPRAERPVPVFLGLNFFGNHTVDACPDLTVPTSWSLNNAEFGVTDHQPTARSRGMRSSRWPVRTLLQRGYGLATLFCGDIDPDRDDFSDGVHPLFYAASQTRPAADEWGTIAAWAWGLGRAMDYLVQEAAVDAGKVIVMGHSRLGKASLWAGALDERFAMVISNNSGCGGAALSRRRVGETVAKINERFPFWFGENFKQFNDREDALPVDQHLLLALAAPRPVYVASAEEDTWADPRGEFLAAYHAGEVYRLLGKRGLPSPEMPAVHQPVHADVGYHIRAGRHDVTAYDWQAWMDFADRHWGQ